MRSTPLLLVPAAACALMLVGCSSDEAKAYDPADLACPKSEAPADTAAQWTVKGTTGEAQVAASTKDHGPSIKVTTPFSVTETQVKTLTAGDGPEVTSADTVYVCYRGVNGRTGKTFDSAYERGEAAQFPVSGVVPGFQKALIGQKGGASVAVVMTPDDGYGPSGGSPQAGIEPQDTLIFELKINKVGA